MADRYWVGGGGAWDATTTHWSALSGGSSGASAPTTADNVIFDRAGTYTVTNNTSAGTNCLNLTISAGTVTFAVGTNNINNVYGNFSIIAGTVWNTGTITAQLLFLGTVTTRSITTNGVTIGGNALQFNTAGATYTLGSSITMATGTASTLTLVQGFLVLNGFNITCGIFSSTNANTRSIAFGANNISLAHPTAATVVLNMGNLSNFSYTGTGGFVSVMSITRTFTCGTTNGTTTNSPNLTLTSGASIPTLTTASTFNTLNFSASAATIPVTSISVNSLVLNASGVYTSMTVVFFGTGTINTNGNTTLVTVSFAPVAAQTLTLASNVTLAGVSTFTHTGNAGGASLVLGGFTLTVGNFISNNGLARSIAFDATNIVLAHTTAGQIVLNMGNITGCSFTGTGRFVSTMSVTRTFTSGSGGGGSLNTAPNLTLISGASAAALTTGSWFNTLDFGTTNYASGIFTINVINFIANNSTSALINLTVNAVGGVFYTNSSGIATLNIITGVTALQSGVTTNCATCAITTGTLVITSGTTLACTSTCTMSSTGRLQNNGTINCTTFTVAGATYNMTSGTITPTTSFTITSGAFNYFSGTITSLPVFTQTAGNVTFNSNFSLIVTGTYTLTAGVLTLADNVTLTTGIFNSTGTTARSVVFGTRTAGNIHLTHTTAGTTVLGLSTVTTSLTWTGVGGFTVADMSNTRTFTMANILYFPLTFTTGASVATLASQFYAKSIDFGTTTFTLPATTVNIRGGTLKLGNGNYSALTLSITTITSSPGLARADFYPNNKSILALTASTVSNTEIWFNGPVVMTGLFNTSLVARSILYVLYDLTCGTYATNGATPGLMIGSNITWTITGATFTNSNGYGTYTGMIISMTSASAKTFAGGGAIPGGGVTYPTLNQGGAGNLAITGSNFFDNITNSVAPCTITFPPSTLQTVKAFNVNGNAGNIVSLTISSGTVSGPSISKPSGIVSIDYVNINRLFSTGGATWYAGANSSWISMPSPAEWIFTAPPDPGAYTVSIGEITVTNGGFKISNDAV